MGRRLVPENPPGTRGLKRDAALVALSQDHHAALVHARALSLAAGEADADPDAARRAVEAFVAFRADELDGHFADEEDVLFPATQEADPESVARLREEHAELRALATSLERGHAAAAAADRGVMAALGALLHDHVRFEERRYFQNIQARLSPEALDRIGRALAARRAARGRAPGCPLPSRRPRS